MELIKKYLPTMVVALVVIVAYDFYKKKRYYMNHSHKNEAAKGFIDSWDRWGTRIKLHIGTVLITLIKESTGIIDYVMVQTGKRGPARFITSTKNTEEWVKDMTAYSEALAPFWMPLKDFPVQWDNKWQGGYSVEDGLPPMPLIKTKDKAVIRIRLPQKIEGLRPKILFSSVFV